MRINTTKGVIINIRNEHWLDCVHVQIQEIIGRTSLRHHNCAVCLQKLFAIEIYIQVYGLLRNTNAATNLLSIINHSSLAWLGRHMKMKSELKRVGFFYYFG